MAVFVEPFPLSVFKRTILGVVGNTTIVPDTAGAVIVVVPATAGAAIVTCPDVSPVKTREAISILYKITHLEPDGMVTTTPADNVIGPTDDAHEPDVMV